MPRNSVRTGTRTVPPPSPVSEPSKPAINPATTTDMNESSIETGSIEMLSHHFILYYSGISDCFDSFNATE
jgi:hypothetical protein